VLEIGRNRYFAKKCFALHVIATLLRLDTNLVTAYTVLYMHVSQKSIPTFSTVTWKPIIRFR